MTTQTSDLFPLKFSPTLMGTLLLTFAVIPAFGLTFPFKFSPTLMGTFLVVI